MGSCCFPEAANCFLRLGRHLPPIAGSQRESCPAHEESPGKASVCALELPAGLGPPLSEQPAQPQPLKQGRRGEARQPGPPPAVDPPLGGAPRPPRGRRRSPGRPAAGPRRPEALGLERAAARPAPAELGLRASSYRVAAAPWPRASFRPVLAAPTCPPASRLPSVPRLCRLSLTPSPRSRGLGRPATVQELCGRGPGWAGLGVSSVLPRRCGVLPCTVWQWLTLTNT